jgi:hypothetical protein
MKTPKVGEKFRSGEATGTIVSVSEGVVVVAWDDEVFSSTRFTKHLRSDAPGAWYDTRTFMGRS